MKVERAIAETFYVNDLSEIDKKSKLPIITNLCNKDRYLNMEIKRKKTKGKFTFKDLEIIDIDCGGTFEIVSLTDGNFRLVCDRCFTSTIVVCPDESKEFIKTSLGMYSYKYYHSFEGQFGKFQLNQSWN